MTGCGGGGADPEPIWYYHFICNGDSACLSTNFAGAPYGTSSQGPGAGGQSGCNSLLTFGTINWNIPPAQQWCDQSPNFAAPSVTIEASPSTVELGNSTRLTWSSSLASTCTASGAWAGGRSLNGGQNITPSEGGTLVYTLACTGPGGTTTRSATVTVNGPSLSLSLAQAAITDGAGTTLNWTSGRTTSCTASGDWNGPRALGGSLPLSPSVGDYSYTLTCLGTAGASVSRTAVLAVSPAAARQSAPQVTIAVSPSSIGTSGSATLSWSAARATTCTATGSWQGEVPHDGSQVLSGLSSGSRTYALACNGSGGSGSGSATLTVTGSVTCSAPAIAMDLTPATVAEGGTATLSWNVTPGASCTPQTVNCEASGAWSGDVANSGSRVLAPSAGSFAYTLTCAGRSHIVSQTRTLTVDDGAVSTPSVDVTTAPNAINLGDSALVAWDSAGVRSCTASGAWQDARGLSGSITVTPASAGSFDYTLSCLGSAATAGDTATLSVQPAAGTTSTARFNHPYSVALDANGVIYVAEAAAHAIRRISGTTVTTVAGLAGTSGTADGVGIGARFHAPSGITTTAAGDVVVGDTLNHALRRVDSDSRVTTLAGTAGSAGSTDASGAAARFDQPYGAAYDAAGNLYVADLGNHVIRKVAADGSVTTFAGAAGLSGSADGSGSAARFNAPRDVAVAPDGNLYVADTGNLTIRRITPAGAVTTFAGTAGQSGFTDATGAAARFSDPTGIAADGSGNLYVADASASTIRKITPAGAVTTFAGSAGAPGANDGTGAAASFRAATGLDVDASGNVYVADTFNCTIRRITPAAAVTTVAGLAQVCQSTN